MANIVKPVPVADYGRIFRDAFGVYQGVRGEMRREEESERKIKQQQELEGLTQQAFEDPNAYKKLVAIDPQRARAVQEQHNVDLERFHSERPKTALAIKGLPRENQMQVLDERIDMIRKRGGDPTQTMEIRNMVAKGDPRVSGILDTVIEQGYQSGYLKRPPQQKQEGQYRFATPQEKIQAGLNPKKAYQVSPQGKFISFGDKGQTINVAVGSGADKNVFGKELAKSQISYRDKVIERAENAENQNTTLQEMEAMEVNQGALEPMKMQLGALGESLGINMSNIANVPAGQAYNAKAKSLVLAEMQKQKGPQTESDMKLIRQTVAGLGQTPQANKFLIGSAIAQNKRAVEERDFLDNWLQEKGNLDGARKAWNKYKRDVPMIGRNLKQGGLPMFFHRFEELAREQDPNASRQDIIDEWNRLDKAAKKQKVPTKKVIDRARPIPAMINTYQERQLGGQYGEPVRETKLSGRYGL